MTTPGGSRPDDERPPSWAGAPGFTPGIDDLPAHAPMPGAPPYPARDDTPRRARGRRPVRLRGALAAAAAWAVINLVLVLVAGRAPGGAEALGRFVGALVVPVLVSAWVVWAVARRRAWPFWLLLLATAPLYWALRALLTALAVG